MHVLGYIVSGVVTACAVLLITFAGLPWTLDGVDCLEGLDTPSKMDDYYRWMYRASNTGHLPVAYSTFADYVSYYSFRSDPISCIRSRLLSLPLDGSARVCRDLPDITNARPGGVSAWTFDPYAHWNLTDDPTTLHIHNEYNHHFMSGHTGVGSTLELEPDSGVLHINGIAAGECTVQEGAWACALLPWWPLTKSYSGNLTLHFFDMGQDGYGIYAEGMHGSVFWTTAQETDHATPSHIRMYKHTQKLTNNETAMNRFLFTFPFIKLHNKYIHSRWDTVDDYVREYVYNPCTAQPCTPEATCYFTGMSGYTCNVSETGSNEVQFQVVGSRTVEVPPGHVPTECTGNPGLYDTTLAVEATDASVVEETSCGNACPAMYVPRHEDTPTNIYVDDLASDSVVRLESLPLCDVPDNCYGDSEITIAFNVTFEQDHQLFGCLCTRYGAAWCTRY